MTKKVTVLRNESLTYSVHLELGDPPEKLVGGLLLDLPRLRVELEQHGCSKDTVSKALAELESHGSVVVRDCSEIGRVEHPELSKA